MVYFSLNVRCVSDVAFSGGDGGGGGERESSACVDVDGESFFTETGVFSVMVIRRFILFRVDIPCVESISLTDPEWDCRPCNMTFFSRLLVYLGSLQVRKRHRQRCESPCGVMCTKLPSHGHAAIKYTNVFISGNHYISYME